MKSCPNCKKTFDCEENNFKGESYEQDDKIETYNHNYLVIEYCDCCGFVLKMTLDTEKE